MWEGKRGEDGRMGSIDVPHNSSRAFLPRPVMAKNGGGGGTRLTRMGVGVSRGDGGGIWGNMNGGGMTK